eukprot:SAG31_NODE_2572_length_5459_cov_3.008396_6_plen_201_part_00
MRDFNREKYGTNRESVALQAPSQPTDENCPDDTAAFLAAFAWATEPFNQITVHVPPGSYRIDGTIAVHASELVLSAGAVLRRVNLTGNTDPIVRLGYQGRLSGTGTLTTMNPSPRGVVNIGPANLTIYENVEYAQVSGIHIQGAGLSWSIMKPNEPVDKRLEGSRGLCFDSSEVRVPAASNVGCWMRPHGGRAISAHSRT